jgi:pimeloyl-ACP methyl ester carboxylesterase
MQSPLRVRIINIMHTPNIYPTEYRTTRVDGLNVFYREAGRSDAPDVALLHGFPSSSRAYSGLIPRLAGRFCLSVPGYPGFWRGDVTPPARGCELADRQSQMCQLQLQLMKEHGRRL